MSWIATRTPEPPDDLRERLRGYEDQCIEDGALADRLLAAAGEELQAALNQPGRSRSAAFDLLTADALVTYACEAALDDDTPDSVLDRLVMIGRST